MKTYIEWHEKMFDGEWTDYDAQKILVASQMMTAEAIAWDILMDVTDRRGWRQEWDQFDEDIRNEIFSSFVTIIEKGIK